MIATWLASYTITIIIYNTATVSTNKNIHACAVLQKIATPTPSHTQAT